jgi:16S rRNA G966 N2-methylase RsmD
MEKESNRMLNQQATAKEVIESSFSSSTTIKIDPKYCKLVNPVSNAEYEILKNSIRCKGLHLPIIINQDNIILDGHNRLRICQELGIEPKFEVKEFSDQSQEKEFVIEINLKRRHLNSFQIAELEYKMEEIYRERAKQRSLSNLKNVNKEIDLSTAPNDATDDDANVQKEKEEETGKVSEIIAKKTGLSHRTYERAKKIIEEGSEDLKEQLRANKTTISKVYDKIQRDRKRQELLSQLDNIQSSNNKNFENINYKLIYGDFIEQSQKEIADSSVDLVLSDPPYGREYLPLYHKLANLALRVLKPGGSLVFYVGHIILDEVIKIFDEFSLNKLNNSTNLQYWWILTVKHSGHHQKVYPRHVFAEWKPLLWYIKGQRVNDLVISNTIGDYIESSPPSKIEHKWQQSTIEAEYIIKNLTLENQTVLDPMMGSGTTGIASLNLRRKFIGIEIDTETFGIAKANINSKNIVKGAVK